MQSLKDNNNLSTLEGSLSIKWGSKQVTIKFDELEYLDGGDGSGQVTPQQLRDAIAKKLDETEMTNGAGDTVKASELIKVSVDGSGNISFKDNSSAGNNVYISGASGKLKDTLGLADEIKDKASSFQVKTKSYVETMTRAEYLSDQSIQVSLNGVTKTIALKDVLKPDGTLVDDSEIFRKNLNAQLDKAFGAGAVTADFTDGKLSFSVQEGSTLSVQSTKAAAMGFDGGLTSYLNTSKTLGDILGGQLSGMELKSNTVINNGDGTYQDQDGNPVDQNGYLLSEDGKKLYGLTINGV